MARPRKPTADKLKKRKNEPGREGDVEVTLLTNANKYPPPKTLLAGADVHWARFVQQGIEHETLTEADLPMLAMLANKMIVYQNQIERWSITPDFDDDGIPSKAKKDLEAAINTTDARIQSLMAQFGFTPGSRSGMMRQAAKAAAADPASQFSLKK